MYSNIKTDWGAESHVKLNITKIKRSLACQFRLGVLPLQVELGRFTNTPRNRRICTLCKAKVEDEIHFLFKCSNLQETHAKMYAKLPEILNYANLFDRLTFPRILYKLLDISNK